jgi:Transposase IS116/IS110/IS902 family
MPYKIAGIDVHKRMLAVAVSEVEIDGEHEFERRQFGSNPAQLRSLAEWLVVQQVEEVVMESTAQYWKPVWGALEQYWKPICQKRDGAGPTVLGACQELNPIYRRLLKMALEDLHLIEKQIGQLDQEVAELLRPYQDQVQRLAEVPGLGVDSAQQIIAEVGVTAATFPSERDLSLWVGACPGDNESAGVSHGHRSPKGNRQMRRLLNQAANAAVKYKGSIFQILYRRYVPRLGHNQTIGVIAHRLCRLVWKILNRGVRYEERGPSLSQRSRHQRAARMIRELRSLGYRVELPNPPRSVPA